MAKELFKVVIRLLPPEITEEELVTTLGEAHLANVSYRVFVEGERVKGDAKPSRNSLCYLHFGSEVQAEDFVKDYHGHQFVDSKGENFRAVACFAAYQKAPRKRAVVDARDGTIEDDATYKEFVESLSAPKGPFVPPEDPKLSLKGAGFDPGSTPLLQYMKVKAEERRARFQKKKKAWNQGLESVEEDYSTRRKSSKWRCSECGATEELEEDPDDRGTFYCCPCWDGWETGKAPSKPKKKKKKDREDNYWEEEKPSKSKKKTKAAADAEWWAEEEKKHSSKRSGRYAEEDKYWEEKDEKKKKKKKKKDEEYAAWEADEAYNKSWKPKRKEDEEWQETEREKEKRERKDRKEHRDRDKASEKAERHEKREETRGKGEGKDSGRVNRWKVKAPEPGEDAGRKADDDEKPHRSRREKREKAEQADEDVKPEKPRSTGGGRWVAKG